MLITKKESDARVEDAANFGSLRADEFCIFRNSGGKAGALDGRVIHIYKDYAEIRARATGSGNPLSQQEETDDLASIDRTCRPSIDRFYELGQRACDSSGRRRFQWETRDEYDIYRDEHGNA